jgi:inhibitor of KinA sporulation pathway (predicted exonuclease)
MATTVNEKKVLTLIDGTQIEVRPLKISLLREFMKKFEQIAKVADNNDKSMDILMECVQIAMRQYNPELAGDVKILEDNLDLPTVYKIVEEASGVNMSAINNIVNP